MGLKSDLRKDEKVSKYCVPFAQAYKLVSHDRIREYVECSAKDGYQIQKAVETAAYYSASKPKKMKKQCMLI